MSILATIDTRDIIADENLVDIVTTGLEGGGPWFVIDHYRWSSGDGLENPWAVVSEGCDCWEGAACEQLSAEEPDEYHKDLVREFPLDIKTLRVGLERYMRDRLNRGWSLKMLIDNIEDMDIVVADAILQFAVFEEERYG